MSYLVVVVLGMIWLGFFLPGLLQAHRASPFASASTFQESLTRISTGHAVTSEEAAAREASRRRNRHLARRRDTLLGLAAAVVLTLLLGLVIGGGARWLVLLPGGALVAYTALLRHYAVSRLAPRPVVARPVISVVDPVADDEQVVVPSVARRQPASAGVDRIAG